jgi:hypothetical protein
MLSGIRQFIHRILTEYAVLLATWAARFAPSQPQSNTNSSASTGSQEARPRPTLTPEQEAVIAQAPPSTITARFVVSGINRDGIIPGHAEQIVLTPDGKAIARTQVIVLDDHGIVGPPGELKGICMICQKFCFQGASCPKCGNWACPGCLTPVEVDGRPLPVCTTCAEIIKLSHENWS